LSFHFSEHSSPPRQSLSPRKKKKNSDFEKNIPQKSKVLKEMTPRGEERGSDNAPEPPPKPGEDSGGRNDVAREQAACASPREKEEEEEDDDLMREEDGLMEGELTTGTNQETTRPGRGKGAFSADRRKYKALVSDDARRLGEEIIAHMKNKSSASYSRYIWRYLFFCEQKAEKKIYISLPMFEEFLQWYDEYTQHLQTNYKICGAALAHVVRYFLHLDDADGESVDKIEAEKRFRSSELLTREQARKRAAGGKDKDAMAGIYSSFSANRDGRRRPWPRECQLVFPFFPRFLWGEK